MSRDPLMQRLDPLGMLYRINDDASRALLVRLGFEPNDIQLDHAVEGFIGEYCHRYESGRRWVARIFVQAWPAIFWRFEITTTEGKRFQMSTGSGVIADYWPTVEKIGEGMVAVIGEVAL